MSNDKDNQGLDAETASRLHRGAPLEDGNFTLEYNRDSEEYYYLIYNHLDGKLQQRCHFKRVERTGENMFNLAELDQRSGVYITLEDNHDLLYAALVTLSNVTPDKAEGEL
jgi:hypothetical protein